MKLKIELTKKEVQKIIAEHIREALGEANFDPSLVTIETRSEQNYKSEWESADFRVYYEGKISG